jgi:hypothetical protein
LFLFVLIVSLCSWCFVVIYAQVDFDVVAAVADMETDGGDCKRRRVVASPASELMLDSERGLVLMSSAVVVGHGSGLPCVPPTLAVLDLESKNLNAIRNAKLIWLTVRPGS